MSTVHPAISKAAMGWEEKLLCARLQTWGLNTFRDGPGEFPVLGFCCCHRSLLLTLLQLGEAGLEVQLAAVCQL